MSSTETSASETVLIRVWDVPVRLFHWLLVALLGFSWWSGEQHLMDWHRLSGYAILAVLLFRFYWGVVGAPTARFGRFVRGPRAVLAYLRASRKTTDAVTPGHNPLGGWSVVAMLAIVSTMVVAGLFSVDVDGLESGPLADYVSFDQGRLAAAIHGWIFNVLLALVALHVLAIFFYLVRMRENLIGPMVTGGRRSADEAAAAEATAPWLWKALVGAMVAGLIALAVSRGFRV